MFVVLLTALTIFDNILMDSFLFTVQLDYKLFSVGIVTE